MVNVNAASIDNSPGIFCKFKKLRVLKTDNWVLEWKQETWKLTFFQKTFSLHDGVENGHASIHWKVGHETLP